MKNIKIFLSILMTFLFLQNVDAQKDTLKIDFSKVSGSPGETVCVDVIVRNAKDLLSLQFSVKFDPSKLEYTGVTKGTLTAVDANTHFSTIAKTNNLGLLKFAYDDLNGFSLPDGSVAFSICFLLKGKVGDIDNIFIDVTSDVPPRYAIGNDEYTPQYPTSTPVKIVAVSSKPLKITISCLKAKTGDTICIPIKVIDFTKIKDITFDITWDAAKLKFEYLSSVNLQFAPNGKASTFYSSNKNSPFSVTWNSMSITSKDNLTLKDSTVIFTLCFKVLAGENETTLIKVSNTKIPTVITSTSNGQNVGTINSDGCVRVPKKIPPVKLLFCSNATPRKVKAGEVFCIDVKAEDFDSIAGMKVSLGWDPLLFELDKAEGVKPINGMNNVSWTFNDQNKTDGYVVVLFESPAYSSVANGETIFQVCLKARGTVGLTSGIKISDTPVEREANSKASGGDDISVVAGDISCPILVESPIKIGDTLIVQPNCKNPFGGSVEMKNVNGGLAPYTYQWSAKAGGGTTPIAKGLQAGIYYCTITDSTLPRPNVLIAVYDLAGDLTKPKAVAKVTGNLQCKDNSSVTLDGAGSSSGAAYGYQWISQSGVIDGSDTGLTAKAVSGTMYYLEVTDSRNGCMARDTVNVAPASGAPIADAGAVVQIPCVLLKVPVPLDGCNSTPKAQATYSWSSLNGGTIKSKFTDCNPLVVGKGTYILTVTLTATGCKAYSKTQVISDNNTPIAIAEVTDSLNCKNNVITLDGMKSSSAAGVKYQWSSIEGHTITNADNIKATATLSGTYILKVTNSLNCSESDTIVIYDFRKDTVSATVVSPARISCDGSPTVLNGSASTKGADINYNWIVLSGSSGKIIKDATTTKPTIEGAGKYLLTVTNKKSYCEAIASVTVLQANTPQGVDAGIDTTLTCLMPDITLNAEAPLGADFDLKWTTKGGVIKSGTTTKTPNITKAGVYYFTVTEKTTKCRTIDSLRISENKDKPSAKIIGDKTLTCGKDSIELKSSGSQGADVFEWFTKDGKFCSSSTTPDVIACKGGVYILLATKVSNGCADSAIHEVKFIYPDRGNAGRDTVLCSTSKIALTGTLTGNSTGLWTAMDSGKLSDKTSNLATVDSMKAGRNRFLWVVSAPGCPDFSKDTVEIFVEKNPLLKDDVIAQRNNGQALSVPVTLNDDLKGTKSWKIELLDKPTYGTLTAATKGSLRYEPSPCFAGVQNFSYKICSDACPSKCDTAKVKMNILEDPNSCKDIVIPNTITPNGDGKNDVFRIDAIEFQPDRFKNAELVIFNRWGDVVYKSGRPYANNWGGTNANGNDLPEATYYYILDLNLPDGISYKGDITILK
jgi:gliding motility-associated-like protein